VIAYIPKISIVGIISVLLIFGSFFNLNIIVNGQLEQEQSVRILSSSEYQDEAGYYHIIGEVENTSPDAQEFIKVTASLYDPANRIVETGFTYTDVDVLRPGEKSPFDIILDSNSQANQASSYKLSVLSENSDPKPSFLKITVGDNYYDSLGYAHVLGEVTNHGSEATQYAKVSGSMQGCL
jgi:hypothetical protein